MLKINVDLLKKKKKGGKNVKINVKYYFNEENESSKLIKDIDKDEYTLEIGLKDSNTSLEALKEIVEKNIREQKQNNSIEVNLIEEA